MLTLNLHVQAVSCLAPNCPNPYTPEGECCPRCPTNSKQWYYAYVICMKLLANGNGANCKYFAKDCLTSSDMYTIAM